MWLTLHRKWNNYSGSLQNYERVSYDLLLKGPLMVLNPSFIIRLRAQALVRLQYWPISSNSLYTIWQRDNVRPQNIYSADKTMLSTVHKPHKTPYTGEKENGKWHLLNAVQLLPYMLQTCCSKCTRKQPSNLSSVSESTYNRSYEQQRANRHKSALSFK